MPAGEIAQPCQRSVHDRHVCAESQRSTRGLAPGCPPTEDHDVSGIHARHTAQQDAAPTLGLLQAVRANLDGHPAGDFAHRSQERQRAVTAGARADAGTGVLALQLRTPPVTGRARLGVCRSRS